jgi:hypothetical protein
MHKSEMHYQKAARPTSTGFLEHCLSIDCLETLGVMKSPPTSGYGFCSKPLDGTENLNVAAGLNGLRHACLCLAYAPLHCWGRIVCQASMRRLAVWSSRR